MPAKTMLRRAEYQKEKKTEAEGRWRHVVIARI
jgi:hypothetical protein